MLECAHYVQKANNNQWASWIKQNLTSFRPSGPNIGTRIPSASGIRRTHILQRAAGKMFYQWGEVIGMRLEEMLLREKQNHDKVDATLNDPDKQNELMLQDEEEDFLDEGIFIEVVDKFSVSYKYSRYSNYSISESGWKQLPTGVKINRMPCFI